MRRSFCLLVVACLVTLATGCGGGGPMSRKGFRTEASRICRRSNVRVQRIDVVPLSDAAGASRSIGRVVAIHRDSLAELRELKPPKPDLKEIDRWLAVVDQLLDEANAVRTALAAGDVTRVRETVTRTGVLDDRARVLASDYGIVPCRLPARSLGA